MAINLSDTRYFGDHSLLLMDDTEFNEYIQNGKYINAHSHTWNDWYLIPSSRPVIAMPKEKSKFIDMPGVNGSLDISEFLTGYMLYGNRSGNVKFMIDNWHENWTTILQKISTKIHGRRLKMVLTDEPEFYYEGRFYLDTPTSNTKRTEVTLRYELGPYKHDITSSADDWLWDPFNFETGVIRTYKDLTVDGSLTVTVLCGQEHSIPNIWCTSDMIMAYKSNSYNLVSGNNIPIRLEPGSNSLTFYGNGRITIAFRRGLL